MAEFATCTLTAIIHEFGHIIIAEKLGYKLDSIVLMPFGAVANGIDSDFAFLDEIKIAIAGPITNLIIATTCVALWWVYPETYCITEITAISNFSIGVINLLPVYPLDGGRVLFALLSLKLKREKAEVICKRLGVVLSVLLLAYFIYSIFVLINLSLLFFALFVFLGCLSRDKSNKYIRIYTTLKEEKLMRGIAVKRQAVSVNITVGKLIRLIDSDAVNEIELFDNGKYIKTLYQTDLDIIIENNNIKEKLNKVIN